MNDLVRRVVLQRDEQMVYCLLTGAHSFQGLGGYPQQFRMQVREVVAAAVRPVLIAVCRKELTGIRRKRDLVPLEISPLERRGRQSLKSVGIDDDVLGVEPKHVVVEQEVRVRPSCALGLERVAGGVQCLRET